MEEDAEFRIAIPLGDGVDVAERVPLGFIGPLLDDRFGAVDSLFDGLLEPPEGIWGCLRLCSRDARKCAEGKCSRRR